MAGNVCGQDIGMVDSDSDSDSESNNGTESYIDNEEQSTKIF